VLKKNPHSKLDKRHFCYYKRRKERVSVWVKGNEHKSCEQRVPSSTKQEEDGASVNTAKFLLMRIYDSQSTKSKLFKNTKYEK